MSSLITAAGGGDIELPDENDKDFSFNKFFRDLHVQFLTGYGVKHSIHASAMSDYLLLSGLYWSTVGLSLLDEIDDERKKKTIQFVHDCFDCNRGAFKPSPYGDYEVHLLFTLSAVQILTMLETNVNWKSRYSDQICNFVFSLQQPDGSFAGDRWGEIDTRFSFCAVATLALIDRLSTE